VKKANLQLLRFKSSDPIRNIQNQLKEFFNSSPLSQKISMNDVTAIKVHFGEDKNHTFLSPSYIKPIVDVIKSRQAKPFVTDTNVLYKSKRDNAVDHLLLANHHGFSIETLGAPLVIADGILGKNETEITIDAPINQKVNIASEFLTSNSIVVVTHATGHLASGLGATIKNLGMGMSSRKGKLMQHSVSKPMINTAKCINCLACYNWCPADSIIKKAAHVFIDENKCIGCGECLAQCRHDAVKFKWDSSSADLQKQIAEHALGIVKTKGDKMIYFTFLINMTKDCDCIGNQSGFVMEDIGVLLGDDPVALDQAVLDLTSLKDKNLATMSYENHDPTIQISYGEKIGLGVRKYKLTEFTA